MTDVLPTVLGIVLIASAAVFALLPFVRGTRPAPETSDPTSARDRALLYRQVLELEFDHQVGKLSDADFRQLSSNLLARAADLLREEQGSLGEIDAEIEREIAAARAAFAAAKRGRRRSRRTAEPVS